MKRRALPLLAIAGLMAGLLPGVVIAQSRASGVSPALVMDKTPVVAADVSAPGADYGLFSCQVGLSTGQCYDPYQMRAAYGVDSLIANGYDGTGKTIVIVDAFGDPNIAAQLDYFDSFYGLPAVNAGPGTPSFTVVAPDGSAGYDPGWAEEISLDVLWAHAIAPGANIVLEIGYDNNDDSLIRALNDAIDHNRGDVVSMSFGESDTCLGADLTAAWHQAFVKATRKGITLFASSGDQGVLQPSCDNNSWIKSASSPASDPLVTAVGGTELVAADYCLASLGCDPSANPAAGTYKSETAWNEGDPYGDFGNVFGEGTLATGGGFSSVWGEPSYQNGIVHGGKHAGVPDVAYNAAVLHGVLTYLDIPDGSGGSITGFYRFGGTSAGSPQWAAITAIADQMAGRDLGFINAALYKIGQAGGKYATSFHDVTSGTNSSLEFDSANNPIDVTGYDAGKGWDATTGLGSPKTPSVASYLAKLVTSGQGTAAINGSKAHPVGKGNGTNNPH
jgi:subtilase family serine protease